MRCILAIDSGGSKCDTLLVHEDGTILGSGHVDVANPDSGRGRSGSGRSGRTRMIAVRQAMGEHVVTELLVISMSAGVPENSINPDQVHCLRLLTCSEVAPGFALVGESTGVVVMAGTGAVVVGSLGEGRYVHLDGLGPMLGDYGGGFHIGMMALRAAAKAHWHPRHRTSLSEAIQDALQFQIQKRSLVGRLVSYANFEQHDRSEIARIAHFVDDEARAGDRVAREILYTAADAIAETVWDVIDTLGIANDPYPLIGLGSIATKSDIYWQRLCEKVAIFAPNFRFRRAELPTVVGMALIALRKLHGEGNEPREKLLASARDLLALTSNNSIEQLVQSTPV